MTYNEIYKILFFWKDKFNYNQIMICTKKNLIIVTFGANHRGAHQWVQLGSHGFICWKLKP
jgi:hypothetical protein